MERGQLQRGEEEWDGEELSGRIRLVVSLVLDLV